ncbi:MAG: hypothetical protein ABW139_18455 [Candidatus Thiodiazotropha sp. DIVDIV]
MIFGRMISKRRQIAERFLSEGNGEATRLRGNRVRELSEIHFEAYRKVEEVRGLADAKASEIYAKAHNLRRCMSSQGLCSHKSKTSLWCFLRRLTCSNFLKG